MRFCPSYSSSPFTTKQPRDYYTPRAISLAIFPGLAH